DGRWTAVDAVSEAVGGTAVYNLRVAEHHTYFVGDPAWGFSVWAHNTCGHLTVLELVGLRHTDPNGQFSQDAVQGGMKIQGAGAATGGRARVSFWWNRNNEKLKVQGDQASELWNALFRDAEAVGGGTALARSFQLRGSLVGLPRNPRGLAGQKLGHGGS